MFESIHTEEFSQATLYQDLTEFIKIFKTILATAQSVSLLLSKSQQCENVVQQLKDSLTLKQRLINHYNYELDQLSPHRNTYYRFVWRIIESLEVYKNRTYGLHPIFTIFTQYVNRTQAVINSYKNDKNIGKLFKRIFSYTAKFCSSCQIIIFKGCHEEAIDHFCKKQSNDGGGNDQNQELHVKKIHFNNSQSNFHKVMGGLSRRFHTMSCLDLDYNSFKAIFFQTKNQKNQLFKDMLQRNNLIYRQINLYSRQFQEYLKRREKQIIRKNRFKEGKSLGNTFTMSFKTSIENNKSLDVTKIVETEKEDNLGTQRCEQFPQISMTIHSKRTRTKQSDTIDDKFLDFQKRKTSYQIKNVYLTLNKIHTNTEFNHSSLKNQRKNGYDKSKVYSILKSNKYALKSTKFVEPDVSKINRPILEIRQIQCKNMEIRLEQSGFLHCTQPSNQRNFEVPNERLSEKINSFDKRNIRITQNMKKTSFTSNGREQSIRSQNNRLKNQDSLQQKH